MTTHTISGRLLLELEVGGRSQRDYSELFAASGAALSDRTNELLRHPYFTMYGGGRVVKRLVTVPVCDFGFDWPTDLDDAFFKRIAECGFDPCLSEIGPALWLRYGSQPVGEALLIGMRPLVGSDDSSRVFVVQNTPNERRLHWALGCNIPPEQRIVLIEAAK
jgi:hypothetical protein